MAGKKPRTGRAAGRKRATKKTAAARAASKARSVSGVEGKGAVRENASSLYGQYFVTTAAGGRDLRTDLGAAKAIESGVSTQAVDDVIEAGLVEAAVVYDLVLPRRTLAYRKSREQRLTPEESDRLARVLRVFARTEDALGDAERAVRWIRKPNRALEGMTPLELLSSEAGARAVEKVLGRLEHGVFS